MANIFDMPPWSDWTYIYMTSITTFDLGQLCSLREGRAMSVTMEKYFWWILPLTWTKVRFYHSKNH